MKKDKSFTLIELLVTIAIIGLISSITLVAIDLPGQRQRAKIAKTLEFSQSIQSALGAEARGIWEFDEGSDNTATERSGYRNNGTINGGASYTTDTPQRVVGQTQGQGKYALSFNGSTAFVDAGNGSSLQITLPPITMEAWIKPNTVTATAYPRGIISKGTLGANGYGIGQSGNKINLGYHGSGNFNSNATIVAGTWYHIVGTIDTGNNAKIYINGQLDSTGSVGISTTGGNLLIGVSSVYWFNGLIDEVRIYGQALTLGQIQKHYAEGLKKYAQSPY